MTSRPITTASVCAITCQEGAFAKFLREEKDALDSCDNSQAVAAYVRGYCGVESRKELNEPGDKQDRWLKLKAEYEAWLTI